MEPILAKLTVGKDEATLTVECNGDGVFSEVYTVKAYDSMAENIARDVAAQLGWEIVE